VAEKKSYTGWIIGGVILLVLVVLYLKKSSGPQVINPPAATNPLDSPGTIQALSSLTGLAQSEAQSQTELQIAQGNQQSNLALASIQAQIDAAAINGSLNTAKVNAATQVALGQQQSDRQNSSSLFSTIGTLGAAALPFLLAA
jgi:hypothetical protein